MQKGKNLILVGVMVLVALSVGFFVRRPFSSAWGQQTDFHYHYQVRETTTLDRQIKAMEQRIVGPRPSGIDMGILADMYYAKGRRSGDTAFFDRAAETAQKALVALPSPNPTAKAVLAKVAGTRHRFAESVQIAQDMLKENPGNDGAMAILATDYLAMGDMAKASEYADQVVMMKPLSANIALRALVLLSQGRDEEGVFEFRNALAKEQFGEMMESSWIRTVFGRYYLKRGNLRLARELFQEAIRITPEFPLALDLLGQVEAREGHFAKAESYFNEAFAVSRQIPYLLHLAMATSQKGERGSADALRTQAEDLVRRELGTASYGHRLDLARLLLEKGTPAAITEAVKLTQEETHLRQSAETYYTLSQALFRAKRWAESREAIFTCLRTGVRDADYFYQAAEVERQIGSVTRADFYLEQVRQLDPTYRPSENQPVNHLTQNF